jgi:hypothetical protein
MQEDNGEWGKHCTSCKRTYLAAERTGLSEFFGKSSNEDDGFSYYCKTCTRRKDAERKAQKEQWRRNLKASREMLQ